MTTYYAQNEAGKILGASADRELAEKCGLNLTTERRIVSGYDGGLYFEGEQPTPPVRPKNYSVPDLFFWLRGYDEGHPETKKGQSVIDFLNQQDLYTIAVTTRVVSEDNELFAPTITAVKQAVGFTDEEVSEALAYAETNAAPDAAA